MLMLPVLAAGRLIVERDRIVYRNDFISCNQESSYGSLILAQSVSFNV